MSEYNESVSGVEPVQKKNKAPLVAGITAGVVAVAAGGSLIAYNTSPFVKNKVKLATLSPKEYYSWINDLNTSEQIEYLSQSYSKYVEVMKDDSSKGLNSKMNVTYTMSDGIKNLAKNAMGGTDKANAFIDNINNVSLILDESMFKGILGFNLGLDFNGTDIADIEMSMDYANMFMAGRIPQIKEKYIGMDIMSSASTEDDKKVMGIWGKLYGNPEEILTESEFRSLAEKYTSLWNDCISDVKQEKGEEVTVGSYTNEYTVLTVEMNKENLNDVAEKYISAIKDDEIIRDIIVTRLEICDEEKYIADLDNALEKIKSDEGGEDDGLMLTIKTYVDPTGEIRGYTFNNDDGECFEMLFTGESEQVANGIINLTNSDGGTDVKCNINYAENDGKYTGSVDMNFTGDDEAKIVVDFTDFEMINKDYGYVSGNLSISIDDSAPFKLVLESDGSSQKANFDIDIDDINYGNIAMEISASEISEEIKMPEKSEVFIIDENSSSLEGYITEQDIINFAASVIQNIGFADNIEDAKAIVNAYIYGSSTLGNNYSSVDDTYEFMN